MHTAATKVSKGRYTLATDPSRFVEPTHIRSAAATCCWLWQEITLRDSSRNATCRLLQFARSDFNSLRLVACDLSSLTIRYCMAVRYKAKDWNLLIYCDLSWAILHHGRIIGGVKDRGWVVLVRGHMKSRQEFNLLRCIACDGAFGKFEP